MSLTTRKMSARHEDHLVEVLGGRLTRGSGSVWHDKTDGKHRVGERIYRFAWDGKSTIGKSISVSLAAWDKVTQQAEGLIPLLPLRFYGDERLTRVRADLAVIDLDVLAELLEDAELGARAREAGWHE